MAKKKSKAAPDLKSLIPAMYPTPPTKKLPPRKIVDVDPLSQTITLEGPVPPELLQAIEQERRRLDLFSRLEAYGKRCLALVKPWIGERPQRVSSTAWENPEQLARLNIRLPENAPAEARDALLALRTQSRLLDQLMESGDLPESVNSAVCLAIDLGKLLQRTQTQLDYGSVVDTGKRAKRSTSVANDEKRRTTEEKKKSAHAEFVRRMQTAGPRMKTATLQNMSAANPSFGTLGTLKRWAKNW